MEMNIDSLYDQVAAINPKYIESPDFSKNNHPVNSWHNYVPLDIVKIWDSLSIREKKLVVIIAELQAEKFFIKWI